MVPDLTVINSTTVKEAVVGDIITYELICSNNSNIDFENIVVTDLLSPELKFINGSVEIDLCKKANLNIIAGAYIGNLKAHQNIVIKFKAQVIYKISDIIVNKSQFDYTYKSPINGTYQSNTIFSNPHNIAIRKVNLSIFESVNKESVSLNETVNYNIKLINDSDIDLENIIFFDRLPSSLKLIEGSFNINSRIINNVDLDKGVNIGYLHKSNSLSISFSCIVTGSGYNGKITSESFAQYSYSLSEGSLISNSTNKVSSNIFVLVSNFKQLTIDKSVQINSCKPGIDEINDISSSISISKSYIIQTPIAVSNEGLHLSGYKLIIHGFLHQMIQYTSNDRDKVVHSTSTNIAFSSFLILPSDYESGKKLDLSTVVEHTYYSIIDERSYFTSATILLSAKVLNFI